MELALADSESGRAITRVSKRVGGDKEAKTQLTVLEKIQEHLSEGQMLRAFDLSEDECDVIAPFNFLTLKPLMYIANVSEDGFENNPFLDEVRALAKTQNAIVVPVCAAIEAEISELDHEEKQDLSDLGCRTS